MRVLLIIASFASGKSIYHENYNNAYDVPSDYDKTKCPNSTVFVDIGMFFVALVHLGTFYVIISTLTGE